MKLSKKGFTMVELLVAMAIMGLLLIMAFPTMRAVQTNNNKKNYNAYGDSLLSAAKLYMDAYADDVFDMTQENDISNIETIDLKRKGLIRNPGISGADCLTNSSMYVIKYKDDYQYCLFLKCIDSNGNAVYEKESESQKGICQTFEHNEITYEYDRVTSPDVSPIKKEVLVNGTHTVINPALLWNFSKYKNVFLNWKFTNSSGESKDVQPGEKTSLVGGENFKANYRYYKFTLKYDGGASGVTGSMDDKNGCEVYKKGTCVLGPNQYKKDGYHLKNWKIAGDDDYKDGEDISEKEAIYNAVSKDNDTLTATVVWDPNVVKIYYDSNGGSLASNHGAEVTISGSTIKYNNSSVVQTVRYPSTSDLWDWNNSGYINLKKVGYTINPAQAWYDADNPSRVFSQNTVYTTEQLCPNIKNQSCELHLKANWKRTFECKSAGNKISYMGKTWYVNSNANGYCDLSMMGTDGSGSYNNAATGVWNAIKGYSNGIDTLEAEKNAGLVDSINTNSGTGGVSSTSVINGVWWYGNGAVYFGNPVKTYSIGGCHHYFKGTSKTNAAGCYDGKYCTTFTESGSVSGGVSMTNSKTSYTVPYSRVSYGETATKVSRHVNRLKYKKDYTEKSKHIWQYYRDVFYKRLSDGKYIGVSLPGTSAKGNDGKSGCTEHGGDKSCPEANSITEALSYDIVACGGGSFSNVKNKDTYYYAGGTNYIYGSNRGDRRWEAEDTKNNPNGNAPGTDCAKIRYYYYGTNVTATFTYRPHIRVKNN